MSPGHILAMSVFLSKVVRYSFYECGSEQQKLVAKKSQSVTMHMLFLEAYWAISRKKKRYCSKEKLPIVVLYCCVLHSYLIQLVRLVIFLSHYHYFMICYVVVRLCRKSYFDCLLISLYWVPSSFKYRLG